jgi:hypothetical protein
MMKFIEEQITSNAALKTRDVNSIVKLIGQIIGQSRELAQQLCSSPKPPDGGAQTGAKFF